MPRTVVLVVDGLGTKHLGPYGNTWIETPTFNRLASQSLLIDGLYAPSPNRAATYQTIWQANEVVWPAMLNDNGVHTQLLTDEPSLLDHSLAAHFAQQDKIDAPTGMALAHEWDETHTAQFFAQALQAIEANPENGLLWIHSRGLWNPWDAPYDFREQFVGDGDPEPSSSAQVPSLELDADFDPDALHEIQCAFGGQLQLIDQCLAVLLAVLDDIVGGDTLFLLTSTTSFPLGEHTFVGCKNQGLLYHEALSVPAFARYSDGTDAMKRRGGLFELGDLTKMLGNWMLSNDEDTKAADQTGVDREFSISRHDSHCLLRTPYWSVIFNQLTDDHDQDISAAELYLKPDDHNEVNDAADRCDAVVEAARQFVAKWDAADRMPQNEPALPEILLEPFE